MEKFTSHTGIAVPLKRSNVDTDQIIPAVYLKRVTRSGFEDGLFSAWRSDPDFVLNQPQYSGASVLVAGPDFGTGSLTRARCLGPAELRLPGGRLVAVRRHLPWQLRQGRTARRAGRREGRAELWDLIDEHARHDGDASTSRRRTVQAATARTRSIDSFDIDDYTRWRLLEGLDDIGITLGNDEAISAFESTRPAWKPVTSSRLNRPVAARSRDIPLLARGNSAFSFFRHRQCRRFAALIKPLTTRRRRVHCGRGRFCLACEGESRARRSIPGRSRKGS